MTEIREDEIFFLLLAIGGIVVATNFLRIGAKRVGVPAVVGYLLLGFAVRWSDDWHPWLAGPAENTFLIFADVGVIVLLFRVGLDVNIENLLSQLKRASGVWCSDVLISGLSGYGAAQLLGLDLIPSLMVAVAFTATSIGVTVVVWKEAGKLNTKKGELLLDVAELDDLSGVVLLALLLGVIPALHAGDTTSLLSQLGLTTGLITLKLAGFGALCVLLSKVVEPRLRAMIVHETQRGTSTLLLVAVGLSFGIASIAGLLGFSLAIGAFFAGLVFSRDPKIKGLEKSFDPLHDFFAPFFFIHIGMQVDPGAIHGSLLLALGLFVAAAGGKILGAGLPSRLFMSSRSALVVGLSMVPRAEIAMIITYHGLELGDWAVDSNLYSAIVLVVLATCLLSPLTLKPLLHRNRNSRPSSPQ